MKRIGRLRSMTAEQLAECIMDFGVDDQLQFCTNRPECMNALDVSEDGIHPDLCKACLIAWLNGEVEGCL